MAGSCSSSTHIYRYDVFISFRGEDTRKTFISHLLKALDGKKIDTYIDYKLKSGDEIGPALLKAIEESKISLIVFSENYASSRWCLDEMIHIQQCKERYQQLVIPIFYRIDPSHVRYQKESYAAAFAKHEERFEDKRERVLKWRHALTTIANLSGFDSLTTSNDSELVERIVKAILMQLDRELSTDLTGLVGVESRIQKIESLLCIDGIVPPEVCLRTVGIWGMGGIGKTTLAGAVFNRLSSQFEASCFLANVREESKRCGLNRLRDELLRELLKEECFRIGTPSVGSSLVRKRLSHTKVLVVLDDVNDFSQLEHLVGEEVQFGRGSRIIITTRDKQLLRDMRLLRKEPKNDVRIYEVQELNGNEALQLFHLNASTAMCSGGNFIFLRGLVDYASGIPLALKIWGSLFRRCKNMKERENFLVKLKTYPNEKLQNVYRVSYDVLEENEREIFLSIACFHKNEKIHDAKRQLDACGLFADSGIEVLIDINGLGNCSQGMS
ncbi:putative TIR domain, P-loop containing nucleoside triphosphate hydrolase [Rosa chinensis]|uniref:Putative TIR domain, P-loop containing nucleoside triphosphate hydrolase n=1 Tax=Rosa chinensis TaxID=74649 RepID=A0A2P6Q5H2_ROSCH|nr:putative TIR domain, P-loop containing nucleoside triphosphate hydrolase [Rosa chinensis]